MEKQNPKTSETEKPSDPCIDPKSIALESILKKMENETNVNLEHFKEIEKTLKMGNNMDNEKKCEAMMQNLTEEIAKEPILKEPIVTNPILKEGFEDSSDDDYLEINEEEEKKELALSVSEASEVADMEDQEVDQEFKDFMKNLSQVGSGFVVGVGYKWWGLASCGVVGIIKRGDSEGYV